MTSILFTGQWSFAICVTAARFRHWLEWCDISSITALSPAPCGPLPRQTSLPPTPEIERGGGNTARALSVGLRVIVHFPYQSPPFNLIWQKQHVLSSSSAQVTVCVKVWERSSLEGGSADSADFQPSGTPSLHMFRSVGSCENVSLVYIKSLNISSTLRSLVGVWKLLFERFSFFFPNVWPITLHSLSFTFVYINSFVM